MRVNRKGVPADLKTVKLKKGESVAMTNGTLQLLKWKDKRDVHMYLRGFSTVSPRWGV